MTEKLIEFKDYEELDKLLKQVDQIIHSHKNVHKIKTKPISKHLTKVLYHLNLTKYHLDKMVFLEYPNKDTLHLF